MSPFGLEKEVFIFKIMQLSALESNFSLFDMPEMLYSLQSLPHHLFILGSFRFSYS
jgi:hypothetical protein